MRSITSRLVIGTSIFIFCFIVLLALSISYSVRERAEAARFDALRGVVYGILDAIDIDDDAHLSVNNDRLPDESLNSYNASLYAEIIGNDRSRLWKSNSTLLTLPDTLVRPINDWTYEKVTIADGSDLLRVQFVIAWELGNGEELPFIVHVAENVEDLRGQLRRFDTVLWLALLAVALILPLAQLVMLRISLKPLRNIGKQVDDIEQGRRDAISDTVPSELQPLTRSLNALLVSERERHAQYKNLLGDLSHNLKTPISVLQNIGERDANHGTDILQQTELMKSSLLRYAERATLKSPRYLSPLIHIKPLANRIAQSLNKLYDASTVTFDIQIEDSFCVRMDESDLLEIFGNVLENACKYGAHNIRIVNSPDLKSVLIEDDGQGWPSDDLSQYIQRGVRADTQTQGQGIGLAACSQIMQVYGGTLALLSTEKGGACVQLNFA